MNWPVKVKVRVKGAVLPVPEHLTLVTYKEIGERTEFIVQPVLGGRVQASRSFPFYTLGSGTVLSG
jgi:hypothetical protein